MSNFTSALALQNSIKNTGIETSGTMLIMKGSTIEDVSILEGSIAFSQISAGVANLNIISGSIVINEGILTILNGTIHIRYNTLTPTFPCDCNILSGTLFVGDNTTMGNKITFVSGILSMNATSAVINSGILNGNTMSDSLTIFSGTTKTHNLDVLGNMTINNEYITLSKIIMTNYINFYVANNNTYPEPIPVSFASIIPLTISTISTDGSYGTSLITIDHHANSYMNRTEHPVCVTVSGNMTFYSNTLSDWYVDLYAVRVNTYGNIMNYSTLYTDNIFYSYSTGVSGNINHVSRPQINFNAVILPNEGFSIYCYSNSGVAGSPPSPGISMSTYYLSIKQN